MGVIGHDGALYELSAEARLHLAPLRCAASNAGAIPNAVSVLEAMSEILSSSAGYELAFSMVLGSMKSVMQSVFMTTGAVAAGLSIAISPTYKDPEMLSVQSSLAIVMAHYSKCPNRVSQLGK